MSNNSPASPSLWWRLIVGLVSVSTLAVIAAGAGLYLRFKTANSQFREQTLDNQARLIIEYLLSNPAPPVRLPAYIEKLFLSETGKFAVVKSDGTVITASSGVAAELAPVNRSKARHFFILSTDDAARSYFGLSVKSEYGGQPVWVQVAFVAGDIVFDSLLEDFVTDIGWIWIPFVAILLLVNLLVARIGLRPLHIAAGEVSAIGPGTTSVRLTEKGLPRDVHALVSAVNRALDRLEHALTLQRNFIADAAHELRTPVSVLKTHIAVLPDFDGRDALTEEVNALDRLVNQLLDSARLEVLDVNPRETIDLNEVTEEIAVQLGPMAINADRSIEVIASDEPVPVNAAKYYASLTLRNIVENAIRHTPRGTTVSIKVTNPGRVSVTDCGPGVPEEHREAVFKRFWQGGDPDRKGAGLGLDIATRSAAACGGTISVDNAPQGGAVFTVEFPASRHGFLPKNAQHSSPETLVNEN